MKLLYNTGSLLIFLGLAGTAGALELGTSCLTAVMLMIIGAITILIIKIEGGTYTETDQEIIDLAIYKRSKYKDKSRDKREQAI